jgi:hypothetical protein
MFAVTGERDGEKIRATRVVVASAAVLAGLIAAFRTSGSRQTGVCTS